VNEARQSDGKDEAARTPPSGDVDFLTDRANPSQGLMKGLYALGCL
jgi:hypothetical protein